MKRILSAILLVLIMFPIFLFAGCTNNTVPNKSKIQQDLNEYEKIKTGVIKCEYVYDAEYFIDNFEIEKRQTNKEDKEDIIFANLIIKNTYFQTELYCKITYLYYDEGGWIFENCEILEKNSIPLTGVVTELCNYEAVNTELYKNTFSPKITLDFNANLTVVSQETDCENGRDIIYLRGIGNNYTYNAEMEFCFDQTHGWIGVDYSDKHPILLNVDCDFSKMVGTFKLLVPASYHGKMSGLLNITSLDEKTFEISGTLDYHIDSSPRDVHVNTVPFNVVYNKEKMVATFSYKYGKYDSEWYNWNFSYDFDDDAWILGNRKFERQ